MTLAYVENRYSDKYRLIDHEKTVERNQKTVVARERARLLSLATNKRRRAIEERRTKEEKQEEERREAILAQRREWQNQATIRFQRAHLPPDKREYNKHNRIRSRTPPRSISVEDALRAIQIQKPERPSSFPRHKGRSSDTFQSSDEGSETPLASPSPKDENNNSPYFHAHFIHTYSHNGDHLSLRGQNPSSRPVSGDSHKSPHGYTSTPTHHGKKSTPETSHGSQKSPQPPPFFRSNSNFDQNSLAKDKLRIITETYNIQPFPNTAKAQNLRPETSFGNSFNSGNSSSSTTTIVPIDTSSRSSSSLHQKVYPSPRHATADRAKSATDHPQNSNGSQAKQLPSQLRGHGMPDAKNSFEKQLELQQKKLLEMQQKTVEDFHKALSNSNELLKANSGNPSQPSDSNNLDESVITKDSLEVESNDSDDEQMAPSTSNSNKRDFTSERPKNPEPLDFEAGKKNNGLSKRNEKVDLDSKPQTSYGSRAVSAQSKFRTPHSTATISAQEAKSLIESSADSMENGYPSSAGKMATKESPEPPLKLGNDDVASNTVVQKPTTNVIKRKPLPINQANTVSKNNDKGKNLDSDGATSPGMTNSNSSIGSQNSNSKALKQEPGPTTAINCTTNVNNGVPAKTPLQYIAYTPIRKWDSPGTTSPKPVAEVAPVLTTPPNSQEVAKPNVENGESEKAASDRKTVNVVNPTSSKSDVMDETQLKHSAKNYMSSITHPNISQPIATVGHVIDPQFSIFNNHKSKESSQPSKLGNTDALDNGFNPKNNDVLTLAGDHKWNVDFKQDDRQEASKVQEPPESSNSSSIVPQKSLIPVPIGKEMSKISVVEKQNSESSMAQQQPKPYTEVRRAYSADERRGSDGSIGSQRSRLEIRSSSPFDRLVDGSNADDIEELEAPDELPPRPKSILKRVSSLENCSQLTIKDSLDLSNVKKASRNATPVSEKPSSAKRSVRFAETIQVQSKAEIDERLPISEARAASARIRAASADASGRRPPRSAPLKPTTSQNVPSEIEQIRATQQASSMKEADYSMTKTPTDDEINALWESIRETMPEKSRKFTSSPADNSSNKSSLYISNGGSNAYYSNYVKNATQQNPPTIASQYIDGSNLFVGPSQYQPVAPQTSVARPTSATAVPRKQHLLGHRNQQNASKAVSPHALAKNNATYQNGAMIAGSFSNTPNGTATGNHVPVS